VAYELAEASYRQAGAKVKTGAFLDLLALGNRRRPGAADRRHALSAAARAACTAPDERTGLQILFELAGLSRTSSPRSTSALCSARDECLGRLDDANPIVEFLTTADAAARACWPPTWKGSTRAAACSPHRC